MARLVGALYLAIILMALLNLAAVETRLVVRDDTAATIANITANETLYRVGVLLDLVMFVLVIVLSWALYELLRSEGRRVALLALILRAAEGVVGAVGVLLGGAAPLLAIGESWSESSGIQPEFIRLLMDLEAASMDVVMLLLGVGGILFLYLFLRGRLIPRFLAVWGLAAYATMLLLPMVNVLIPNVPEPLSTPVYAFGSAFEVFLGLWLLIRGVSTEAT